MDNPKVDSGIKVKGIKDGILIQLSAESWHAARQNLLDYFKNQQGFLKGAQLSLDVGSHALNASELGKLRDLLAEMDIALKAVISSSEKTETTAQTLGLGTRLPTPRPERVTRRLDTTLQGEQGLFIQRTLRSGFKLETPGYVTILGDVNAGAEIIAGGSVVVWGRLRGMVHAGAYGDETAVVCALELVPTQLRLAGEIATLPRRFGKPRPEVASMRDGKLIAEPWDTKGKL